MVARENHSYDAGIPSVSHLAGDGSEKPIAGIGLLFRYGDGSYLYRGGIIKDLTTRETVPLRDAPVDLMQAYLDAREQAERRA